jgi:Flp pilus assembly protein TadD
VTPQILSLEAREALQRGDLAAAAKALEQIAGLTPRDHVVWNALAAALVQGGQAERGVAAAKRAVSLDRLNGEYHNTLGVALAECGAYDEALQSFRRALKLRPFMGGAYLNLGKALAKLDRRDEAIDTFRHGQRVEPQSKEIRNSLALALWERGDNAEAARIYGQLAVDFPDDPRVARDLAGAISSAHGAEEACRHYHSALRRFPQNQDLHWAYARELLALQRWGEGWLEYLWRPLRAPHRLPPPGAPFEPLTEKIVAGRTVLLEPGQGLGDVLFFCRFIDELRGLGARVLLRCPEQLIPLIEGIELAAGPVTADLVLALDDLPTVLGTRAVPAPLPLKVDDERVMRWKRQLAEWGPRPYLALTWRAGTDMTRIPQFGRTWELQSKRIDIKVLGNAVRDAPGTLIAVQRGPREGELAELSNAANRVARDCTAVNGDLAEMAALLTAIDEYAGVSNTNTHIASGVGRAARVLVPHPPEWRWLAAGDASPWYPGARIYRQAADRSWEAAMRRLAEDLTVRA